MIATEHKWDFKLKTDTPYLDLTGELWGVCFDNFEENWPLRKQKYAFSMCIPPPCSTKLLEPSVMIPNQYLLIMS